MAHGYGSCHPDQVIRLRTLGLSSDAVTQGVGSAPASAGTHNEVGKINDQPFGHAIDLSPYALPFTREHFDALVRQGFAPFPREVWPDGGAHWHCVDLTRPANDAGNHPDHLDAVNHQLAEWVTGGDGLVGDAPMPAKWKPTPEQREFAKAIWKGGTLPSPVTIIGPRGESVNCAPVVVGNTLVVDLGPLLGALSANALDLWRDTPAGPSRCKLRQVVEGLPGFTLDTSAWPTVRIRKL